MQNFHGLPLCQNDVNAFYIAYNEHAPFISISSILVRTTCSRVTSRLMFFHIAILNDFSIFMAVFRLALGTGRPEQLGYSLFFPGRRVRAHLQNPATKCDFPIGYFIFLLTLEKCAILQFSVLSLSIRSKLPFLFYRVLVFISCFVLCPFIY
jgi:hypothetical protein